MAEKLQFIIEVQDNGSATIKQFGKNVQETTGQIDKMGSALNVIKWASIVSLVREATAAFKELYSGAREIATLTNEIDKNSKIVGMSTTQYQQWTYAARMADVNAEELTKGFRLLSRNMSEASQGSGNANDAFQAMGLSVTGTTGQLKPLDVMMKEIMNKFAGWADGPQKIALALALFGRSGEALIPLLNKGAIGFEELAREAQKLGIILDPDLIKAGSATEDILKRLEAQLLATKLSLVPLVTWFAQFVSDLVTKGKEIVSTIDSIARAVEDAGKRQKEAQDKWRKERGYPEQNLGEQLGIKAPSAEAAKELKAAQDLYLELESYYKRLGALPPPAILSDAQKKQLGEIQRLVRTMGWEQYAAGEDAANNATRELNKNIVKTQGAIEALDTAFKGLGIQSEKSLVEAANYAIYNLGLIRAEFEKTGKSASDYVNALRAAKEAVEKVTGPDILQKQIDAGAEYDTQMKSINKDQEGWQKTASKYQDDYIKKLGDIQKLAKATAADIPKAADELRQAEDRAKELGINLDKVVKDVKEPIKPMVDTSPAVTELNKMLDSFRVMKAEMEKTINVGGGSTGGKATGGYTSTAVGGSPPVGEYGGSWDANLKNKLATIPSELGINVSFTGSGMSPTQPLGDAFDALSNNVDQAKSEMSGVNFAVDFAGAKAGMASLTTEAKKLNEVGESWTRRGGASAGDWSTLQNQMNTQMDQIFANSMQSLQSFLNATGKELTADIWSRFIPTFQKMFPGISSSTWQAPFTYEDVKSGFSGWQAGGTVTKTGLQFLHEGERVIPKTSSVSMGGITINVPRGTSKEQATAVIAELKKQLKYKQIQM
jgi:hypothetical protein